MAEPITMQKLTDASFDADTLGEFANEDKVVTARLGQQYPSAPMASRLVVENGLLGATPFTTAAIMGASSLVNGDYAVVIDDSDLAKNGFWQKQSGVWRLLKWNPAEQAKDLINKPQLFFDSEIIVDIAAKTVTYPAGVAMDGKNPPKYFNAATLGFGDGNTTKLDYYDYNTNSFLQNSGSLAIVPADKNTIKVGSSFKGVFASDFKYKVIELPTEDVLTTYNYALSNLKDDLAHPLKNTNIKLVGDSITWGVGATGTTAGQNNGSLVTAVRNTTDATVSPTWANLLSRYLLSTYITDALTHVGGGVVYADKTSSTLFSRDADIFSFSNPTKNLTYSSSAMRALITNFDGQVTGDEVFDLGTPAASRPSEFSFDVRAPSLKIFYVRLPNGDASTYFVNVYIDGVFAKKISMYAATTTADMSDTITMPDSNLHTVTIKNESTVNKSARIQFLQIEKRIKVANDGISGSTTSSWLSTVTINDSIKAGDNFVFVQLGTNDRINNGSNSKSKLTRNLYTIANIIKANTSNHAQLILMSANAVTHNEDSASYIMTMRDVNSTVQSVADSLGVPFISNYSATQQLKFDGEPYLSDNLHPNNYGYKAIFNNIKSAINTAITP